VAGPVTSRNPGRKQIFDISVVGSGYQQTLISYLVKRWLYTCAWVYDCLPSVCPLFTPSAPFHSLLFLSPYITSILNTNNSFQTTGLHTILIFYLSPITFSAHNVQYNLLGMGPQPSPVGMAPQSGPQPGNQPPCPGPETPMPIPPSTPSSFAKQEPLPAAEEKESTCPQHFPQTKTRLLATLSLGAQIMVSLALISIGVEVMNSGSAFAIGVCIAGIIGCIDCGLIGVIIVYPGSAITGLLEGLIVISMVGFVSNAIAFSYVGTHMSIVPEHDIHGFPPDLVFTGGVIFWASSTLLQSMLCTFFFIHHCMLRASKKDPEKSIKEGATGNLPKDPASPKGTGNNINNHQKLPKPDPRRRRGFLLPVGGAQNPRLSESPSTVGHHPSPSQHSWKAVSEGSSLLSPSERTVSFSNSSIYRPSKPRPHAADRPQSEPTGYPVPIIHCTPSFDNSENSFNPNIGSMRPISMACNSTTTVSDNMSERSVFMVTGDNDARSVHSVPLIYPYDPRQTTNLNSNRASVATFVPPSGQLSMHSTRSHEVVVKGYASNPDEIFLKIIPQELGRRRDMPPDDVQCLSCYSMQQPNHPVLAQYAPPQFGKPQDSQRVSEHKITREITGQHMTLNNFKFGGKATASAAPNQPQHPQRAAEYNIAMQTPGQHMAYDHFRFGIVPAATYAPMAGPSKPRVLQKQAPMFGEGDDGMVPASVYGGKPAGAATEVPELKEPNFMC